MLFPYIPVSYTHLDVYKRQLDITTHLWRYIARTDNGQPLHFVLFPGEKFDRDDVSDKHPRGNETDLGQETY